MLVRMARRYAVIAGVALAACASFDAQEPPEGDAGPDSATADAAPADEAGMLDAGDATIAFVPCKERAAAPGRFCDDFDTPGGVAFKWDAPRLSAGASVGETDAALSAPRALVTKVPPSTLDAFAVLRRRKDPAVDLSGKKRLLISLALRVDGAPYPADAATGYAHVATAWFDTPACGTVSGSEKQRALSLTFTVKGEFVLELKGMQDLCATDGGYDYSSLKAPYGLAEFFGRPFRRIEIDVTSVGCANEPDRASVVVRVDEASSECRTIAGSVFARTATIFDFELGPNTGNGPIADTTLVYDDVSVEFFD
jgi:hypothetical protein